jgi:competence protein ComEA
MSDMRMLRRPTVAATRPRHPVSTRRNHGAIHPPGRTDMIKQALCALALCLAMALPAFAATPVNINKADAQTIATSLDGIGLGKAQAIVAYRGAHGPFKSVDDLGNVKGVGAKTLDRNRDAIRLTGSTSATKATAKPARKSRKH